MRKNGVDSFVKESISEQVQPGELAVVGAPQVAQPDPGTGGWTHKCFKRKEPLILVKFLNTGMYLALSTSLVGILLLLSTFCTCCILYNVNMSRRGLPTAIE